MNIIFTDGYLITLKLTEGKSLAELMLCFGIDVMSYIEDRC